ncbi:MULTISPECIES: polysaccharide deacetylase family protein [unclassified Minwuia]|uniref:polysaccharide deacetylase family protein n=1 Tax=unclassified Minwuia TaxID=2618799 RepID=UPI0024799E98|nr:MULTISPECIES: polysaccharide deacetylase family protein [unclassified Minwuia]
MLVTAPAVAADHTVVLMYHRFGEDDVPLTNIRLEQFEAHLEHLEAEGYSVLPLATVLDALADGEPLPEKAVAITADDAYLSVMTEAWPRLKARGWPMTLFVATDPVDQGLRRYLSWDQIRQLRDEGMEIGGHSASHGHITFMDPAAARADVARGMERLQTELGQSPDVFAYPFGEYSLRLRKVISDMGFRAAFGQHSGAVGRRRDRFDLPRFAMNERYGEISRFRTAVGTRPLPVHDATPAETQLEAGSRPTFAFRLDDGLRPGAVTCYHSTGSGAVDLDIEGDRVAFQAPAPLQPGRSRFNCTLPDGAGGWYWFGRQFVALGGKD